VTFKDSPASSDDRRPGPSQGRVGFEYQSQRQGVYRGFSPTGFGQPRGCGRGYMLLQALRGNPRGNFRGGYRGGFQAQQNYTPPQDFTQYPAANQASQFEQMGEPKCGKCGLNRHSNVIYCPTANAQSLFCGRTGHYRRCCRLAKME